MRPTTSWKKRFRPFEAVPRGTRKQTGLPRETLLDRGPLLLLPDIRKVASLLDEGRTPVSLERGVSETIHDENPPAAQEIWQKMSIQCFWMLLKHTML